MTWGYKVVRFRNQEVLEGIDGVLEKIVEVMKRREEFLLKQK